MGTDLMCAGNLHENTPFTVDDQLRYLKSRGITFPCIGGMCARRILTEEYTFAQLYAYRELFERRVGGTRDGTYIQLDFAHLVRLVRLDRHLRSALLSLALDIEHVTRTRIVQEATKRQEDQHVIVQDYLSSLPACEQRRRLAELKTAGRETFFTRAYGCDSDLPPLQAYVELVCLGTLSDLYLFCARRWSNKDMRRNHYLLKSVRRIRNACAHGSPVLSGIVYADAKTGLDTHLIQAIANAGIPKRVRVRHMRSERTRHLVTTLYAHSTLVTNRYAHAQARDALRGLVAELQTNARTILSSDALNAFAAFLRRLVSTWF